MANTFKRMTSRNIGTAATSVGGYVSPTSTQTTVIGLSVANVTTSAISVSVVLFDGTNSTHLIKDAPLLSGSSLVVVGGDQKIVLQPNDQIRISSSASTSADAIMSVLEIT